MAEVDKNKISDKQKRRAEHIADRLEDHGMGQDEAKKRALEEVAQQPSSGGHNSGGDSHKPTSNASSHHDAGRQGSDKELG